MGSSIPDFGWPNFGIQLREHGPASYSAICPETFGVESKNCRCLERLDYSVGLPAILGGPASYSVSLQATRRACELLGSAALPKKPQKPASAGLRVAGVRSAG